MKLIQLPTLSFEQKLQQELEENPALEAGKEATENQDFDTKQDDDHDIIETDINVDEYLSDDEIPSYRLNTNNHSPDDDDKQVPYAAGISFTQFLMDQMRTFSMGETESQIAQFLIGSIDDTGYIEGVYLTLSMIWRSLKTYMSKKMVQKVLEKVQQLDPAGVGALDLQSVGTSAATQISIA